ncbi:MAG TPA: hypothetical protein V6C78_19745 [Crinalium sp.]|jgi:hypothetical protein
MAIETYQDPVAKLLTYGDCRQMDSRNWDNYPDIVGLTDADIPELIRMATDREFQDIDSDRVEIWAPVHAWRALAQLNAEEAIAPLTALFELHDDDWVMEELPTVYRMFGPKAIPSLADYVTDVANPTWGRAIAGTALKEIGQAYPDHRDACLAPLIQMLEAFEENPIELNDSIIMDLIDLQAVEAAPIIEKVYDAERVTEFGVGTWASVQIDLGLKTEDDFSPDELKPKIPEHLDKIRKYLEIMEAQNRKPQGFGTPTSSSAKNKKKNKKKRK